MSWLLFMDESGHDHRTAPYEVRGGVAIRDSQLWPFTQAMQRLERDCFGGPLHEYKSEIKGCRLLERKRFQWAQQSAAMTSEVRRENSRRFLTKGLEKNSPTRVEFTAFGQACLEMVRGTFQLLINHEAVLFATAIPRDVQKPEADLGSGDYLRKDHVFLFERFFYFLEEKREHGILVMDEVEEQADRKFVRQMEAYFTKTQTGLERTAWIVPAPFFVSSNLTYPVQAADLCIYCVNWGFRLPSQGMDAPTRPEIAAEFGRSMNRLQFRGEGYRNDKVFPLWGVAFVPNPYSAGRS